MVPERHCACASVDKIIVARLRDAESAICRIFAVHNGEFDFPHRNRVRKIFDHCIETGFADHVTDKENAQFGSPR